MKIPMNRSLAAEFKQLISYSLPNRLNSRVLPSSYHNTRLGKSLDSNPTVNPRVRILAHISPQNAESLLIIPNLITRICSNYDWSFMMNM